MYCLLHSDFRPYHSYFASMDELLRLSEKLSTHLLLFRYKELINLVGLDLCVLSFSHQFSSHREAGLDYVVHLSVWDLLGKAPKVLLSPLQD